MGRVEKSQGLWSGFVIKWAFHKYVNHSSSWIKGENPGKEILKDIWRFAFALVTCDIKSYVEYVDPAQNKFVTRFTFDNVSNDPDLHT